MVKHCIVGGKYKKVYVRRLRVLSHTPSSWKPCLYRSLAKSSRTAPHRTKPGVGATVKGELTVPATERHSNFGLTRIVLIWGRSEWEACTIISKTSFTVARFLPFLEAWKLSSRGTYCISYTRVVRGRMCLSLLMRYTAYLKASSALLSRCSSVNIAPENSAKHVLLSHSKWT